MRKLCADFGRPDRFEEAREWYDGYRFGNAEVYNPWSVLKYVKRGFETGKHWAGTSGNSIISSVLNSIGHNAANVMAGILAGKTAYAKLAPTVVYADLDNANIDTLFSIMAVTGYLNAIPAEEVGEDMYCIPLPNKEMREVFRGDVCSHIGGTARGTYSGFVDAAIRSDVKAMRDVLTGVLRSIGSGLLPNPDESIRAMDCRFREANYHVMMLAILDVANEMFDIRGDMEAGDGHSDITMRSMDPSRPSIVMELKWEGEATADLESLADSAMEQIRDRKYALGMKGRVILYGIAFRRRDVCIRTEVIEA